MRETDPKEKMQVWFTNASDGFPLISQKKNLIRFSCCRKGNPVICHQPSHDSFILPLFKQNVYLFSEVQQAYSYE